MKLRIIKYLLGAALLVFVIWFCSHLRFEETTVPLPLKGEAISNPYYAAIKLSEELQARAAWERVFTTPATDSVILLSSWNWTLGRARRERLEKWVENGGRLVVDDSLVGNFDEFEKWSGVGEVDHDEPEDSDESEETDETEATADDENVEKADDSEKKQKHRVRTRDRELIGQFIRDDCQSLTEDGTNRALSVCGLDESRSLTSSRKLQWALRAGRHIHALRVAVGRGSVTVLNAAPFRYRDFFQGDHPRVFVAATQLHHGDNVLFLTEEDHASLLTLAWRFGAPVVLLLIALVFLALWRNTIRFGPLAAPPEKARRSLAEQIRGTGQFTLRFGGGRALHTAMVRAVREAAIRRLPDYDSLSTDERVAAISRLTGVLASELGPALNFSGARSPHELRNVIAVLEAARRRLTMKAKHGN